MSATALRKIIIDTDPGVDDALALLFAMCSPELQIEAITAVAGNVPLHLAVLNVLRMVEIAGCSIPVSAGAAVPLERRLVNATSHGANGLAGTDFPIPRIKPVAESAAEVIRGIVSSSPGDVSIIAVGPLTNLATAFRAHPDLAKQIREVVIMGGSLSGGNMTPAAEFNIYVDPEAADIVFTSGVPLTMIGLDVTRKCVLTAEHVNEIARGSSDISRAAAFLVRNDLERARREGYNLRPMHDPLAVTAFIDRSLVTLRPYFVAIETRGELTAGETVGYLQPPVRRSAPARNNPSNGEAIRYTHNVSVAVDVDADRFFHTFVRRLSGRSADGDFLRAIRRAGQSV